MLTTTKPETPENYIEYSATDKRTAGLIVASQYKDHIKTLIEKAGPTAGDLLLKFRAAADLNANLQSTFFTRLRTSFEDLRHGAKEGSGSWLNLMEAIRKIAEQDTPILKYTREALLGHAVPALTSGPMNDVNMQVASDILRVAGTSDQLADAIKVQCLNPVVMWHLKNADGRFEIAALRFAELRKSAPFVPVIATVENRHGVHVDSEVLPHDARKNLVLQFKKGHDAVDVLVVDVSRPGRANHPHELTLEQATTQYRDSVEAILLRATECEGQDWVRHTAEHLYCHLG